MQKKACKKGWCSETDSLLAPKTELRAPIDKVSRAIAAALKPGRKMVSAVRFANGRMEEVAYDDGTPAVVGNETAAPPPVARALKKRDDDSEVVAAVSVAAPVLGCPEPDFVRAEVRATEVLRAFLSRDQQEDFAKHQRFISVGASGRRYMITSRHARDELARYHRQLYDLEDQQPLCVHDDAIPAGEELLALHTLVQLPRWEDYLRKPIIAGIEED